MDPNEFLEVYGADLEKIAFTKSAVNIFRGAGGKAVGAAEGRSAARWVKNWFTEKVNTTVPDPAMQYHITSRSTGTASKALTPTDRDVLKVLPSGPNNKALPPTKPAAKPDATVPFKPAEPPAAKPSESLPPKPIESPKAKTSEPVPPKLIESPKAKTSEPVPPKLIESPKAKTSEPVPPKPIESPKAKTSEPVPPKPAEPVKSAPKKPAYDPNVFKPADKAWKEWAHLAYSGLSVGGGKVLGWPMQMASGWLRGTGLAANKLGAKTFGNKLSTAGNVVRKWTDIIDGTGSVQSLRAVGSRWLPLAKMLHKWGGRLFTAGWVSSAASEMADVWGGYNPLTGRRITKMDEAVNEYGHKVVDTNGYPVITHVESKERTLPHKILNRVSNVADTVTNAFLPKWLSNAANIGAYYGGMFALEKGMQYGSRMLTGAKPPSEDEILAEQAVEYMSKYPNSTYEEMSQDLNISANDRPFGEEVEPKNLPNHARKWAMLPAIQGWWVLRDAKGLEGANAWVQEQFGESPLFPYIEKALAVNNAATNEYHTYEEELKEEQKQQQIANTKTQPVAAPGTPNPAPVAAAQSSTVPGTPNPAPVAAAQSSTVPGTPNTHPANPSGTNEWLTPALLGVGGLALLAGGGSMLMGNNSSSSPAPRKRSRRDKYAWVEEQVRKGRMSRLEAERYLAEDDE